MALQPIDIQVNFSQMNAVSAEQTMHKQAIIAAHDDSTRHLIEDSLKQGEKVQKIESDENRVASILDDEESPSAKQHFPEKNNPNPSKNISQKKKDIVFIEDPDKGHEVDFKC